MIAGGGVRCGRTAAALTGRCATLEGEGGDSRLVRGLPVWPDDVFRPAPNAATAHEGRLLARRYKPQRSMKPNNGTHPLHNV